MTTTFPAVREPVPRSSAQSPKIFGDFTIERGTGPRAAGRLAVAATLAAVVAGALVLGGCPPASLIGQPCSDPGDSPCEGDKLLRCDGQFYIELAPCASQCIAAKAPVSHTGDIAANETWACLDGPHLVTGVVTIQPDVTLTIEAGALIKLDPASRINAFDDTSRVDSLGNVNATILLTSNNGQAAGFGAGAEGGFNVFAREDGGACGNDSDCLGVCDGDLGVCNDGSRIEHTIVERGIHGIGVLGLSEDTLAPTIRNSTLRDNENFGIRVTCNGNNVVIPDFAAVNNFFNNGTDVSECNPQ